MANTLKNASIKLGALLKRAFVPTEEEAQRLAEEAQTRYYYR